MPKRLAHTWTLLLPQAVRQQLRGDNRFTAGAQFRAGGKQTSNCQVCTKLKKEMKLHETRAKTSIEELEGLLNHAENEARVSKARCEELETQNEALRQACREAHAKRDEAIQALSQSEEAVRHARKAQAEAEAAATRATNELNVIIQGNAVAKAAEAEATQRRDDALAQAAEQARDREAARVQHEDAMDIVRGELKEAQNRNRVLQQEVNELQSGQARAHDEAERVGKVAEQDRALWYQERNQLQAGVAELEAQCEQSKVSAERLREQLAKCEGQVASLEATRRTEAEAAEETHQQLEEARQAEAELAGKHAAQIRWHAGEIQGLHERIVEVQREAEASCQQREADLAAQGAEAEVFREACKQACRERDEAMTQLKKAYKEKEEAVKALRGVKDAASGQEAQQQGYINKLLAQMKTSIQMVVSAPSLRFSISGEESQFQMPVAKVHGAISAVIQDKLLPKYLNVIVLKEDEQGGGSAFAAKFSAKFLADMKAEIDQHVMPILYGSVSSSVGWNEEQK